jgi:hypothetical protein
LKRADQLERRLARKETSKRGSNLLRNKKALSLGLIISVLYDKKV